MCFVKSSPQVVDPVVKQEPVVRHQADAAVTKNTNNDRNKGAFVENIKTSAMGLDDGSKKTLLGE